MISDEAARKLVAGLSAGRLSTYADMGHLPFFEDPQRFNGELADFARQVHVNE